MKQRGTKLFKLTEELALTTVLLPKDIVRLAHSKRVMNDFQRAILLDMAISFITIEAYFHL